MKTARRDESPAVLFSFTVVRSLRRPEVQRLSVRVVGAERSGGPESPLCMGLLTPHRDSTADLLFRLFRSALFRSPKQMETCGRAFRRGQETRAERERELAVRSCRGTFQQAACPSGVVEVALRRQFCIVAVVGTSLLFPGVVCMKPRIFISAVTTEFGRTRQLVANVLLRLGYDPVTQDIFGTESGDLRQVLREKIDDCDGLLQLVGRGYGAEPPTVGAEFAQDGFTRISYTQFEFLYARARGKKSKTWLIFADDGCTRDCPLEELDLPSDPPPIPIRPAIKPNAARCRRSGVNVGNRKAICVTELPATRNWN